MSHNTDVWELRARWSWQDNKGRQALMHCRQQSNTNRGVFLKKEVGTYHPAAWDWCRRILDDRGPWWRAWCDQCARSGPTGGRLAACWMWRTRPTPRLLCQCRLQQTGFQFSHTCKSPFAMRQEWTLAQSKKRKYLIRKWTKRKTSDKHKYITTSVHEMKRN